MIFKPNHPLLRPQEPSTSIASQRRPGQLGGHLEGEFSMGNDHINPTFLGKVGKSWIQKVPENGRGYVKYARVVKCSCIGIFVFFFQI